MIYRWIANLPVGVAGGDVCTPSKMPSIKPVHLQRLHTAFETGAEVAQAVVDTFLKSVEPVVMSAVQDMLFDEAPQPFDSDRSHASAWECSSNRCGGCERRVSSDGFPQRPSQASSQENLRCSGKECRNPEAMQGKLDSPSCDLDTGNPYWYDGLS